MLLLLGRSLNVFVFSIVFLVACVLLLSNVPAKIGGGSTDEDVGGESTETSRLVDTEDDFIIVFLSPGISQPKQRLCQHEFVA